MAGLMLLLLDKRDVLRPETQNEFKELEYGSIIVTQIATVIYFTIAINEGVIYFLCSVTLLSDIPVR